ncbi:MAG: histidine-type phosphatase [Terracidiphilus sp.]|jgi:4-phytase/acid phosphatase
MRTAVRILLFALASLTLSPLAAAQSAAAPAASRDADLQLVVMLSRHGVRAPIGSSALYGQYAAAPWPAWDVPPGYLTGHGYQLMKLFGAWDRAQFSSENLFAPAGCADAAHVSVIADSDQRTRETGNALAEGMFPGCAIAVHAQPEGADDPLFRPIQAGVVHPDTALATAAVAGRIGGDPNNLTELYRSQLTLLDHVLAGCGHAPANTQRTSIFTVPATLAPGSGDYPAALHGPVTAAATIAENLLLEYTQGMSQADTGWGCIDGATLRTIMQVNSANWDYAKRTTAVAHIFASTILDRILKTMQQSVNRAAVPGALGKPGDRLVILVGHDTNIVTVAGALQIDWVLDGRVNDTPPGGALLFELWRPRDGGKPFVRLEYVAQTLEQMRNSDALTPANPPAVAPIFVPGCSRQDLSCTWDGFSAAMRASIDPAYVAAQP